MKKRGLPSKGARAWLHRDVTDDVLDQFRQDFDFPEDLRTLVSLPLPDPDQFENPESFRADYWRAEMWSKYPFDIEGIDRREQALRLFSEYEVRCALNNARLADIFSRPIPPRYWTILRDARRLLATLFDGFSVDEIAEHCGWGPGATTSLPRARATPQNKWVLCSHITEDALPYFYAFSDWCDRVFPKPTIVAGNRVVTVPKNAKTERTIAIEPDWNMFFQLGLGKAIRRRLRRKFGLLRPIAQAVNRSLAHAGSIDKLTATIDLKGASDTISLALVEALLPPDVLKHIKRLRSKTGTLPDGSVVTYEKVSSMGNGFTFELETAVFYSICRAASGHAVVYGDDIIVTASSYQLVSDILEFCGFEVNLKKSHYSSHFRESCGGHYFKGMDVTPPYVRKALKGPARLSFCNRISELSDNGHWRDSLGCSLWKTAARGIPAYMQGPVWADGVLRVEAPNKFVRRSGRYQCFSGTRVLEVFRPAKAIPEGGLLQALWSRPNTHVSVSYEWQKPPGTTYVKFSTWVGHWQGVSPWSC